MIVKLIHSCLLLGIGIFIFFKEKKIYIYQYHQSSTFVKKRCKIHTVQGYGKIPKLPLFIMLSMISIDIELLLGHQRALNFYCY